MKRLHTKLYIVLLLFVFTNCSKKEDDPTINYLVKADSYMVIQKNTLISFVEAAGLGDLADDIEYDVELYKVTYHTSYKGDIIEASGLVALPITSSPVSMVSFQHGTMVKHTEAPSLTPTSNQILFLYAALAGPGFIAVIPDYIGFGASDYHLHPYYIEEASAQTVIDNLKAAKELAVSKNLSFDQKVFLAGYSEGGYVTMATHKNLEENEESGLDLIASFPAAGGYNIKGMQEHFFSLDTYHEPYYMAYVEEAYRNYYGWSAPISDFFNEPYASRIPDLFNGSNSGGQINSQLTEDVPALINADLLENIDQAKYSYVKDAFIENSLLDWTPNVAMFMYHGDTDITVPYQNSVDTYQTFIDNGSSSVEFLTIEGANHETGAFPFIEDFVPRMIQMRNQ